MALPLVQIDRHRIVDPRRSPLASGSITTLEGVLDVVGRGIAIGFGLAVLVMAGTGAASLAVIVILAIGSALVSWTE